MVAFLIEGLRYSGTETVTRYLENLTGFHVFKFQPQGVVGWIKTQLTKDKVDEAILARWQQIDTAIKAEENIIIHRANHPYILYRLRELLGSDASKLLVCRRSEYGRYIQKAEETRDFRLLAAHRADDDTYDNLVTELLLGATPMIVDTEDEDRIVEQLKHILFGLGIQNIESHIQNNPS